MTDPLRILPRLGAYLADHWLFWLVMLAGLGCITLCSMCCFEKRWLRASISGVLALEAFVVLSRGVL